MSTSQAIYTGIWVAAVGWRCDYGRTLTPFKLRPVWTAGNVFPCSGCREPEKREAEAPATALRPVLLLKVEATAPLVQSLTAWSQVRDSGWLPRYIALLLGSAIGRKPAAKTVGVAVWRR